MTFLAAMINAMEIRRATKPNSALKFIHQDIDDILKVKAVPSKVRNKMTSDNQSDTEDEGTVIDVSSEKNHMRKRQKLLEQEEEGNFGSHASACHKSPSIEIRRCDSARLLEHGSPSPQYDYGLTAVVDFLFGCNPRLECAGHASKREKKTIHRAKRL